MILQGTVSSGGGEWNGRPYQSIPLNQGMEDEVGDKESIIPDQMIGKEVYDDEMNGNTADEPCVESINSSQEEEGDGEGIIVSYRVLLSIVYVSCITGVCVLDEKYIQELNTCNGTVYYSYIYTC